MATRFSEEWLADMRRKGLGINDKFGKPAAPAPEKKQRASKFGNVKVDDPEGGKKFDSTSEGKHAAVFRKELREGKILTYSRQVEFWLPSMDAKYTADHGWHDLDGNYHVGDSKGVETADFKLRWKAVKKLHPGFRFHLIKGKFKGSETLSDD